MNRLWLGACLDKADYVFLLPNVPILPSAPLDPSFLERPNVAILIELNGNHWRKILTIMAKLTAPDYHSWKTFRDDQLFDKVGMVFSCDQLDHYKGTVFIVGNTFRSAWPVDDRAQSMGYSHHAYVHFPYVWCPYLDYRQFPNVLIEALREHILER